MIEAFIKRLSKIVVKSFSKELISIINSELQDENSKVKCTVNRLTIKLNNYSIKVCINSNGVTYEMIGNGEYESKKCLKHKNIYYVQMLKKHHDNIDLEDKLSKDIKFEEVFRVYNLEGFEQFRKETKRQVNYYEDKITGEIITYEPSDFENYSESLYIWRVTSSDLEKDYVLTRNIKNKIYPQINLENIYDSTKKSDDCQIRYEYLDKDVKELPFGGHYYGFDSDLFFKFFQNKSTIGEIYENVRQKKYHMPNDIKY